LPPPEPWLQTVRPPGRCAGRWRRHSLPGRRPPLHNAVGPGRDGDEILTVPGHVVGIRKTVDAEVARYAALVVLDHLATAADALARAEQSDEPVAGETEPGGAHAVDARHILAIESEE